MKNFSPRIAWFTIILTIAIISIGVIVFQTDVGKKIWEGLVWFYRGLEDFNFNN